MATYDHATPYTPPPRRRNGSTRQWRTLRVRILQANDTCWICGQPGADSIDHVTPVARGGSDNPSNLRPAHHNRPPFCNRIKGDRDHTPIIKRSGTLK